MEGKSREMMEKIGLVLEGGGMRAVYTAGALEYFLEHDIHFPYVIGVSAGASYAASYLSKQMGRNKKVSLDYVKDPRYMSWRNFRHNRQFFGMDFIYDEIPSKIVPFDYETFYANSAQLKIGTTDVYTGESIFYGKEDYKEELLKVLRASSSLPFLAPPVAFKDKLLLDGGISASVPIDVAKQDGYTKNVVILTRNKGYRKSKSRFHYFVEKKYPQYNGLQKMMKERFFHYNKTMDYLDQEEKNGNIIIIRPLERLAVGRMERNPQKLSALYFQGYEDAKKAMHSIKQFQF
ncbi:patatin family protein [Niallia sp. NCCP-28]|uniref:patatin-like phospholipase family protein n=1 Tax=Niallia sp. NCCP-28 TaxID=2934712 RepID=UPI0020C01DA8|nr:patatin family protein [Niallia sp. NCCP-28]